MWMTQNQRVQMRQVSATCEGNCHISVQKTTPWTTVPALFSCSSLSQPSWPSLSPLQSSQSQLYAFGSVTRPGASRVFTAAVTRRKIGKGKVQNRDEEQPWGWGSLVLPAGDTSSPAQHCSPAFPSSSRAGGALPQQQGLQKALLFLQLTNGARELFDIPWCPAEQQNRQVWLPDRWLWQLLCPDVCLSQQWVYFRWLYPGVSSLKILFSVSCSTAGSAASLSAGRELGSGTVVALCSPGVLLLSVLQGGGCVLWIAEVKFINSSGMQEGKTGSELSGYLHYSSKPWSVLGLFP